MINLSQDIIVYTSNKHTVKTITKKEWKGYSHSFTVMGHIRRIKQKDRSIKIIHVKPFIKGKGKFKNKTYKIDGK